MNPFQEQHGRFARDSRHIFGHRFQVEKPSRDWPYIIASLGAAVMLVIVIGVLS